MKFKTFTNEGIIVPKKIKVKSNDVDELNKQFKNSNISFHWDTGPHGAYIPKLNQIKIYLVPDLELEFINSLISHEIIHTIQDSKSGMRMGDVIQKQQQEITNLEQYVDDLDDDEEINPVLLSNIMQMKTKLEIDMEHLNDEERMAYAYMYAKMYKKLSFKEVTSKMIDEWIKWTNKKPNKKMMKYFAMYWMVKDEL